MNLKDQFSSEDIRSFGAHLAASDIRHALETPLFHLSFHFNPLLFHPCAPTAQQLCLSQGPSLIRPSGGTS